MSCKNCHTPIINTITHHDLQSKYLKLFRIIFVKRPIELVYCAKCYEELIQGLESEINSRQEHKNEELHFLKRPTKQTYSITEGKGDQSIKYSILNESNHEYQKIAEHFHRTLSYPIIRIEKCDNPLLEKKFRQRSNQLTCQNIKYLFHGSNNKAYDNILETGFDVSYAAPTGLLGSGIYFAEDAIYSHGYGLITLTNLGKINHILYCKVNIGHTCLGHYGITETPKGYDGVNSGYNTWAVFDNYQGIPKYIIYYLVQNCGTLSPQF